MEKRKAGIETVAKVKLNFIFNNPNSVEDTAEALIKILAEINAPKVEEAIKKAADESEETAGRSA